MSKKIKTKESNKIEIVMLLVGAVIISIIGLYNLEQYYCLTIINDEFAYWAMAAKMAGKDWTPLLSTSNFYSYGYSFIIVPLFWLGISMTSVYRIAIILNVLLLIGSFLMTAWVGMRLFGEGGGLISRRIIIYISLAVTLYVGNIFQLTIAWTEIPLYFTFWVITVFMYRVLKPILLAEKPNYPDIIFLAVANVYIYTIHNRTLGVMLTTVFVVIFLYLKSVFEKKLQHRLIVCLAIMAALFLLASLFRQYTVDNWYNLSLAETIPGESATVDPNDYQAQITKITRLTSLSGLSNLILSLAGKLYYQATASFLLIFIPLLSAAGMAMTAIFSRFKKRAKNDIKAKWGIESWMIFFGSAAFAFEIAIAALYKSGAVTRLRAVDVLYGRYPEFAIGPVLLFALAMILMKRNLLKEVAIGAGIYLFSAVLVGYQLDNVGFMFMNVNNAPGVYRYFQGGNSPLVITLIMTLAGLAGFVLVAGCSLLVQIDLPEKWHPSKVKRVSRDIIIVCIAVICLFWCVSGINNAQGWVERNNRGARDTIAPIQQAMAVLGEETEIYYVVPPDETLHNYIKIYQSLDPDRVIHVNTYEQINANRPQGGYHVYMSRSMEVTGGDLIVLAETDGLIMFVERDSEVFRMLMEN
ncbi:MAG: hypothetical protein FWG91_02550 [Lachnospiraceae bacterium]|nr:hypothetical protein [Lachnospiraceae bacterium]